MCPRLIISEFYLKRAGKNKMGDDLIDFFNKNYDLIDRSIESNRKYWQLNAINHFDYDDAKSEICNHIFTKLHLYKPEYSFSSWVNTIIRNQIKNLLRNKYYNVVKPCIQCPFRDGENGCLKYVDNLMSCKLYSKWDETKKDKYNLSFTVTMENHIDEIHGISDPVDNIEDIFDDFKNKMKNELTNIEFVFFNLVYLQNKTEKDAGKMMGFKTNKDSLENIKIIKNNILAKARDILTKRE